MLKSARLLAIPAWLARFAMYIASMSMFSVPTYIVLDLPPNVSTEVLELRKHFDKRMANLPPEITIAGSSGVGVLSSNQDATFVFEAIESIGKKYLPFLASFASLERFPNVPIFWLKPKSREPFDSLQNALVTAGILFESNSFPFNPHCTISSTANLSQEQELKLLSVAIPKQDFVMSTLSVYQLVEDQAKLLQSFCFLP